MDYLPAGKDGKRGFLPKQQEFYNRMMDPRPDAPKFGAYIGGIGSGKSVIGCAAIRDMAIRESGDYLVCRQFMPELKMTTWKTLIDMIPPELIIEHRIADSMLKVKAMNGVSNIYARPLEDWNKMRSLNLNAFLIDEANQVTEEAFLLLQGRLRGRAWRKGLLVSNPNGHDWCYRLFYAKNEVKSDWAKNQFFLVRAPSTENFHLSEDYLKVIMETWSEERIDREIRGSFDAFEGSVYSEFRRDIHVIKPFKIPDHWPRFIGIDHGLRNPSAWVWIAVGPDGELYAYREFYKAEWLIEEIITGKKYVGGAMDPGTLALMRGEKIEQAVIDPSVNARKGSRGETHWDEYLLHLPGDFPLYLGNNKVELGIDRVKNYLKIDALSQKPLLYFFDTCTNLLEEISQYRYPDLKPTQEGKRPENEKPVKCNDHALDALRYVVMLMPDPAKEKIDKLESVKYNSLEYRLIKDLERFSAPKPKDPFGL